MSLKDLKILLVTPPLLEPKSFYLAMPLLCGQLRHSGYSAENLDLNVEFFRTVLSRDYILKTKEILDVKQVEYDKAFADNLAENIDKNIEIYKENLFYKEEFQNAQKFLFSALKFISLPYPMFNLDNLSCFEYSFGEMKYDYESIKKLTFDIENNIFISFFEEIIDKVISKQDIDIIGITIPFVGNLVPALTLARLLKEKTNIYVSLGGNFLKKENIFANPEILDIYCDSVISGRDGEEAIVELAKSYSDKQNLQNVPGLIYKDESNAIKYNPEKIIVKMDNIANLALEGINLNDYFLKDPFIYIMISKGCYWGKCTFCSLGHKYKTYCIKKPEKVVAEIKELKEKYNLKGWFLFQDDAIPPLYLNRLADEIFRQSASICYFIFARFEEEFDRDLLYKLYRSGLRNIYWGLESGCKKTLEAMNKGIKLETVQRILKDSYEIGITNMAGVIVNFPTETMEEYNETIDFLNTIKQYVTISPGNFTLMKNSIVAQNCEKYGVEIIESKEDAFGYTPVWKYTNLTPQQREAKWNHFCEYVKQIDYQIDSNKKI